MKFQTYSLNNFRKISRINKLSAQQLEAVDVVGNVLPF